VGDRLVAVAGRWSGSTIPLLSDSFTIGRAVTNDLVLLSRAVSRYHCAIRRQGTKLVLMDVGGRQLTFLNGQPIQESVLRAGDRIGVADSEFIVSIDGEDGEILPVPALREEPITLVNLVERAPEDSIFLQSEDAVQAASTDRRSARALEALLRIASEVNAFRSPDALARRLVELTLQAIPAQRGAVLLAEGRGDLRSVVTLDQSGGTDASRPISGTIVRHVLQTANAVLSNNARAEADFQEARSIVDSSVRALLCTALKSHGEQRGVLYLDSDDPADRFDELDLQLLMAIGAIGSAALENARHIEWLENETRRLNVDLGMGAGLVGEGARIKEVGRFVAKVSPTDTTVLIRGETGTGKEVVARAVHAGSLRATRPFVAVNCAALAETLLESELFGHEKGAFTGAVFQKRGRIEAAEGGTLFLDEIGEMAPTLQAKLLRVLQEREYERVGSSRTLKANVRVITATHRDLEQEVRDGKFRQDLYYRLNVVGIALPPLRERREDIPLFVDHFVAQFSRQLGKRVVAVAPDARLRLMLYDWPGNVRELQNVIERAVVMSDSEVLTCEDLPEALLELRSPEEPGLGGYHLAVNDFKRRVLVSAVREADGNLAAAARKLGLHPNYLHRLVRNMNLRPHLPR
jgi:Nif-specific regulatory protein